MLSFHHQTPHLYSLLLLNHCLSKRKSYSHTVIFVFSFTVIAFKYLLLSLVTQFITSVCYIHCCIHIIICYIYLYSTFMSTMFNCILIIFCNASLFSCNRPLYGCPIYSIYSLYYLTLYEYYLYLNYEHICLY